MADLALLLFIANGISAACVALYHFLRRGGYLGLPFLTSVIFLSWYLPQAHALLDDPTIDPAGLVRLFVMSLLCFWAMMFGWGRGMRGAPRRPARLVLPIRRLVVPVLTLTLVAWAMTILIEMQPAEARAAGQWSGPLTILAFFSTVAVVSMALSTAMVMQARTPTTLILFGLNVALYVPKIVIYFRRADTFEFALAILLALFFVHGRTLSRTTLIVAGVAGFFFVNGVGHLRALTGAYQLNSHGEIETRIPTFEEIAAIDWLSAVDADRNRHRSEVRNAVVFLEVIEREGSLTLGAQFWNKLVFAYVPGQIVGYDLKNSLMIGTDIHDLVFQRLYYEKHTGTTRTGFVDPYRDFWYFGCFIWWLSGLAMGYLMRKVREGHAIAYTLYAATITNAVLVTTHFGYYLFSQSVLILLATLFVAFWLRRGGAVLIPARPRQGRLSLPS